jgi:hypothetical protein
MSSLTGKVAITYGRLRQRHSFIAGNWSIVGEASRYENRPKIG